MKTVIKILFAFALIPCLAVAQQPPKSQDGKEEKIVQKAFAWTPLWPSGLQEPAPMDTLDYNYYQRSIPSAVSYAYDCTGNLGAEGKDMLFLHQQPISQFFLLDAQRHWIPTLDKVKFYNTRVPMTIASYNFGGTRDNGQERLQVDFSGNINKRAQIGATLDYLYSKGSYANQAAKGFTWGFEGSYIGDRYEFQGSWAHFNNLNKENGGITNDLYITDPAKLQGGVTTINPKAIPTNLTHAHTRVKGGVLFLNNRYKVGFWREEMQEDSTVVRSYVPVTSFFWTMTYLDGKHRFLDNNYTETDKFFANTYLNPDLTDDFTTYWALGNTVGVSMLEGFNKWAKFGMSAFATYEIRKFTQTVDTIDRETLDEGLLTPFPASGKGISHRHTQNLLWLGAQISKQQGSIFTFEATGRIGLIGDAVGEVIIDGNIKTRIPLLGDTVAITGYGHLGNTAAPYLLRQYLSNHFIWNNDFGKERRLRLGGILDIPWTNTQVNVATETLQNLIYFGPDAVPVQNGGSAQVFSATLDQRLKAGILHWDNKLTYQTSTNDAVMPLPKFAFYSNLYILCRIATLHLQLGVDCNYYTRYYAPAYQPATATFYNQREMKLGNFPYMTVYANMRLSRVRFYVMMSHVNQGLFGNDYFSSPHYPLNPRRLLLGLSVDFQN